MSRVNYRRLGDYIIVVKSKNTDLKATKLLGINIDKFFMPSVANVVGTDLSRYKIVSKNQFACNRMHVGRDYRIPVALSRTDEVFMVSPAYDVFEIIDTQVLNPDYLMMWFSRKEFDRNAWFYTDADVRGGLSWNAFCDMQLPIPTIEKQNEIVKEYNTVVNRIKLNEQLNQKLEETAQAIYKHWFVDFEFPCLPSDYCPHGQINPKLEDRELLTEINKVSTYKRVGGLPVPDGKSWFIYVLLCLPSSKDEQTNEGVNFYKGMTNDLYRRFYEHYTGQGAEWTKTHKPVKIIHWEKFDSKEEAAKREKELKSGYGRTWLNREYEKFKKYGCSAKTGLPAHQTRLMMAGKMVYNDVLEKEIPEGWEVDKIENIISVKDGTHDSPKPTSCGYPLITSTHLKRFDIAIDDAYLISEEDYIQINKRSNVEQYDILFSMIGTVGIINFIQDSKINYAIKNVGLFKSSEKKNISRYIYLYLNSRFIKEYIDSCLSGSTQSYVTLTTLREIPFLHPQENIVNNFEKKVTILLDNIYKKALLSNKLNDLKNILLSKMSKI